MGKGKNKDRKDGKSNQAAALASAPEATEGKKGKRASSKGFDAFARFAEHPLVSELLAVGAIAAVGVIAEHRKLGEAEAKSAKAVKTAGKAAATAIGARLLKEFSPLMGGKKSA